MLSAHSLTDSEPLQYQTWTYGLYGSKGSSISLTTTRRSENKYHMTFRIQYVIPRISGAFAKLQKAIISFVTSACLSVRPSVPMEQFGSHWTDFNEIWYLRIFRKSVEKTQVSLETDRNEGQLTWRPKIVLIISHSILLRIKNASDKVVEKIYTHILFTVTFFPKIVSLMR
jgi:hypothetical protein